MNLTLDHATDVVDLIIKASRIQRNTGKLAHLGLVKDHPKVTFDFSELTGVVFGMKAETSDKLAIVRIIAEKCKKLGRKDFQIRQMRYLPGKGLILV